MPGFDRYWEAVWRMLPVILVISLLLAVGANVATGRVSERWGTNFSYIVLLDEREIADEYRFDGYYALQAAGELAENVEAWAGAPETVAAAHAAAQMPIPVVDVRGLSGLVEAKKVAPQVVRMIVWGGSREAAEKLADGLTAVMIDRVEAYHEQGVPAISFNLMATDKWTGARRISGRTVAAAVFGLVLLLGINGVLLREALRDAGRN